MTLREELTKAIEDRERTLSMGWCKRKDYDQIRVSIGRAKTFLIGYPVATDEQVREWCKAHTEDLCRIVPGNQPRRLARLLMDELRRKAEPKEGRVIEMKPTDTSAA